MHRTGCCSFVWMRTIPFLTSSARPLADAPTDAFPEEIGLPGALPGVAGDGGEDEFGGAVVVQARPERFGVAELVGVELGP